MTVCLSDDHTLSDVEVCGESAVVVDEHRRSAHPSESRGSKGDKSQLWKDQEDVDHVMGCG